MGGGSYSTHNHVTRAASLGYHSKTKEEIFTQRSLNTEMDPRGVRVREARDSEEHPASVAIVLALDVTGSMGRIPHELLKDGLPHIMGNIIEHGMADPQVLFMGIGDHMTDRAPLQIGQFESSDELLDKWLKAVFLEGAGGGNAGESYHLAWYFAAKHTSIDCMEKRGQKGFIFTVGDEPLHPNIGKLTLKGIMGDGEFVDYSAAELLELARKSYHVFHVHIQGTYGAQMYKPEPAWREMLGDNLLIAENGKDVARVIKEAITRNYSAATAPATATSDEPQPQTTQAQQTKDEEEEML